MSLYQILLLQFMLAIILILAVFLVLDFTQARSASVGVIAYLVPNSYFIWRARGNLKADSNNTLLQRFYFGEIGKLLLTAMIFALAFILLKPLNALMVFAMFGLMICLGISSMVFLKQL